MERWWPLLARLDDWSGAQQRPRKQSLPVLASFSLCRCEIPRMSRLRETQTGGASVRSRLLLASLGQHPG
ncbi:hypothetical protein [Synechococcus sp. M16CYN]|uniref:hypothetical protein n=1 Tax=Synechococcus sp. M16CYN TaxID=3103139 RepID=UPI003341D1E7